MISNGTLTKTVTQDDKSKRLKKLTIPRTLNRATGKESLCQAGFSDTSWGNKTREYAAWAGALTNVKFDRIVRATQPFMNLKLNQTGKTTEAVETINVDNELACLVDNDDSSDADDCKFPYVFATSLTW